MDEEGLETSIDTYQQQLDQVNQAIQAAGCTPDLQNLKQDLEELINLTKESLLSLKKSTLLKQLDDADQTEGQNAGSSGQNGSNSTSKMDDEYAAFQAMLGDNITSTSTSMDKNGADDTEDFNRSMSELYADIVGTKCRAPFVQSWGEKRFGNALIVGIDDATSHEEIPKVRVMFCNPTHQSMLPCKYFLDGDCKFTEENCRCSHGYQVALEELQEYIEPDYSSLKMESKCLARYDDDLWYKATVVDINDDKITVMFDSYEDEAVQVEIEDILPLDLSVDKSDSEDENEPITSLDDDEEEESLPVFLWKPPSHGLGDLGQWEAHTRGIGSKLLTKMGYEPGKGLGKVGEGRILPVPIQLLPQGKSLDKIMKLKELAGDRDMFDAMKKLEKRTKRQNEKMEKALERKENPNVFDFINHKLRGKKGNISELFHKPDSKGHKGKGQGHSGKTISEHDLHKKSEKSINIQLFKTAEEMKSVEKELDRLKQSLARNENRDRNVAAQVRSKIQSLETYRDKLQSSEQTIQNHQRKRSDHRKLTVF